MQKGKIGVTTENIFPIIKKFLYSDHEIFLRELVSNAVDATQKLKTVISTESIEGNFDHLKIKVLLDKEKKTLTISDKGIGMTHEEIENYINQIAFSSAGEFLEKYKDKKEAIIGHFGLGFYSSFMVSERVDIYSKSYKKDEKAIKWSCDGSPEYSMEEIEKDEFGTDIVLHIAEDSKEFLEENRIHELLRKYCKFLPVEIAFGEETEYKDGKETPTGKDKIINETKPAWRRKPADLKDEDYRKFYVDLYPVHDEPLFNIHLNVDYPFNLTGILYFPKIKKNIDIQKNKIQLYSNQVFVTDSVEGIVPEFLTLLHGVIDSPDIPLNVSRSYLQSDSNVKKISGHITKKVADRLNDIFKKDRKEFEKKWDNLKLFINYGILTDEKFFDKASKFYLFKNTDGTYFTFEEYKKLIESNQTDKDKNLIYLYASKLEEQYSFIENAKNKAYDVLLLDGDLDSHIINKLEQKFEKSRFSRVDADVVEKLIQKEENLESNLTQEEQEEFSPVFKSVLGNNFNVSFETLKEDSAPIIITQNEFMRRMKDMAELSGGGTPYYGNMPDSFNFVVNSNHPLIKKVKEEKDIALKDKIENINAEIIPLDSEKMDLEKSKEGKKEEEILQADKDKLEDVNKKIEDLKGNKNEFISKYGKENKLVSQLIDLALISNNMLKGKALDKFVKRSLEIMK